MLTKILLTLTAAAALSCATPAFAIANLVLNPGFELTGFTDWTQFGNTGATGVSGSSPTGVGPHGGLQLGWFGAVGSDGGIYQDLTTVALQTYNLTFWLANDPGTPNDWSVLWNGVALGGVHVNVGPFGYTQFSYTVLGTGGLDELRFSFRQDPRYFELDDISVTSTSVPDGGNTLWLLGLAMVSICLIRRWAPAVSVR